jgi:membrane protein implicated in regulation of membrane protease activity
MSKMKKVGKALGVTGKALNYTVTLGGSKAAENARKLYADSFSSYEITFERYSSLKTEINIVLENIGFSIASVQPSLIFCQTMLNKAKVKIDQTPSNSHTVEKLQTFRNLYNSTMTTGFGGAVGGASAAGAWIVVSMVGSASTGAAISGLSGVAAYNATMAWFGGGALAAGGAGMSGGMMILGGIVAAPLVLISTKMSYSNAKKLTLETDKVNNETEKLTESIAEAEQRLDLLQEDYAVIQNLNTVYIEDVNLLRATIFPRGRWSKAKQYILQIIGKPSYTGEQGLALVKLRDVTDVYLANFEKRNFVEKSD